jgi:hypothetical protein
MATSDVISRVRKLLALSEGTTSPAEAATAAARARELIAEYRLAEADLAVTSGASLPEEDVVENQIEGDYARKRASAWRVQLAGVLARSLGCKIYYYKASSRIQAIGRESDVQTLGYLQGYLALEITRLTEDGWRAVKSSCGDDAELPQPARWRNSFRLGVVSTIRSRLAPQRPGVHAEHAAVPIAPSTAQALVLARDVAAQKEVDRRWKVHFPRKRSGGGASWAGASHGDGYWAGKQAGETLDLDRRGHKAIGGAKPKLDR